MNTEYSATVAGHGFDLALMWVVSIHNYKSSIWSWQSTEPASRIAMFFLL